MADEIKIPVRVKGAEEVTAELEVLREQVIRLGKHLQLDHPIREATTTTKALHEAGKQIGEVVAPAVAALGITLGLSAGALAATLVGVSRKTREFADKTLETYESSKEARIALDKMKGFGAAAEIEGIEYGRAIEALDGLSNKVDAIRNHMSELRVVLTGWGEGELVSKLEATKNNTEALEVIMKRLDELRGVADDRAYFLAETLLGEARFRTLHWKDIERFAARAYVPTQHSIEVAKQFKLATIKMDEDWAEVKQSLETAVLPGFTKSIATINDMFAKDPHVFDPIAQGFRDAGAAMRNITARDLVQSGRALGLSIEIALRGMSGIYNVMEWLSEKITGKSPMPGLPHYGQIGRERIHEFEQLINPFNLLNRATLPKTKELLHQLNNPPPGQEGIGGAGGVGTRFGNRAGYGTPGGFRGHPSGPQQPWGEQPTGSGYPNVRYNNPGAMYPGASAQKFGTTGTGVIGGGHLIANFPTPVHGAAANMDNLRSKYVGMTIGGALQKWSGGGRGAPPGYDPNQVITPEMLNDPKFMIPFMKAITAGEAPGKYPMTDEQWKQAYEWYQAGKPLDKGTPAAPGGTADKGGAAAQGGSAAADKGGSPAPFKAQAPVPYLNMPGRQEGGPVTRGSPYVVGEHGPELFIPQDTGRIDPIMSDETLLSMLGWASTGSSLLGAGSIPSMIESSSLGSLPQLLKNTYGAGSSVVGAIGTPGGVTERGIANAPFPSIRNYAGKAQPYVDAAIDRLGLRQAVTPERAVTNIRVRVKAPRGVEVSTNARGDGIGRLTTQRTHPQSVN